MCINFDTHFDRKTIRINFDIFLPDVSCARHRHPRVDGGAVVDRVGRLSAAGIHFTNLHFGRKFFG
jgi:hypothetical protein